MARFLEVFPPEKVSFDVESKGKSEVIGALLDLALKDQGMTPQARGRLLKKILERESNGSTAVGSVAIPHVKVKSVEQTIGAMAVFPDGIDFQAVDGEPVYSVFLLISPESQSEEHLQALRWIARLVRQADYTPFVRRTRTPEQVMSLLEEMGS